MNIIYYILKIISVQYSTKQSDASSVETVQKPPRASREYLNFMFTIYFVCVHRALSMDV